MWDLASVVADDDVVTVSVEFLTSNSLVPGDTTLEPLKASVLDILGVGCKV